MFDTIKGAIFDLDGTLVDSMGLWARIDEDIVKTLGLEITPHEIMKNIAHYSFNETALYFKEQFQLTQTTEELQSLWMQTAEIEYATNVLLKPGARSFLDQLKAKGVKLAVATSNNHHLLNICLKANRIEHYFDALVTTDDTKAKSKSEPDVYLHAAQSIGVAAEDIVVFEDVPHAMRGARRAGMKVVAVNDAHTALTEEEALSLADLFIQDFTVLLE